MLLAGCVSTPTKKDLVATGGSRADGTVQLSYEMYAYETVETSEAQGLATAKERCAAWGYPNAQPFGGQAKQCQFSNQYGCISWFVTVTYQCLSDAQKA
jgi:hypothetical protein